MLDNIIKFALNNRIIIIGVTICLILGGIFVGRKMEVDVFPDLNAPTVVIMTEATGMAAEDVETIVTFPIETGVNGATNVRRVRSSSTMGFSVVWVEFEWGTDIYKARQIVNEKLASISDALPKNVGTPTLGPQSSIMGEVLIIGLTSETTSIQDLRTLADWTIRPRLLALGGVAQVTVIGGDIKEYQISLLPDKMNLLGVTLKEVIDATQEMNENLTGGTLYQYSSEYIIRGMMQTKDLKELGSSVVKKGDNGVILLNDIANIKIGSKTPVIGWASEEGEEAVLLTVTKQPNINTLELTDNLDKAILEIEKTLPAGVKVSTDIFRQERFINSSIDNVKQSLVEGSFFVVVVLFFFLMNWRTTFISLMALPVSFLISLLIMKLLDVTINTMSLGGLAIAIGSLVDDAVIDVENVYRHINLNKKLPQNDRKNIITVVYEASKEVRMPILNSTLIIVASFTPLFFLSGMEGRMLTPLGISFIIALFASTFVALTLTPVLCTYLLSSKKHHDQKEPWVSRVLKSKYSRSLTIAMKNKKIILILTGALLLSSIIIISTFGRNFLPSFNEGSLTISINTMPGVSMEASNALGEIAENALLSIPEIVKTGRKTGRAELDEHSLGINSSEIEAPFVLTNRSKNEFIDDVRNKLGDIPGIAIEIGQPISHRLDHMLSGTKANIAIKIFGPDLNKLYDTGVNIQHLIDDIPGVVDLNVEQQVERPQVKIVPDRIMMAKYGITMESFAQILETLVSTTVSQVYEDGKMFELTLKFDDSYKDSIDKIKDLMIDTSEGYKIPFGYIAKIETSSGPNTINKENAQRLIVVSANVSGRDLRSVVDDIQKTISEKANIPEGYHIQYGGQFESEQEASRILLVASIFAIFIIYLLLYVQFKNNLKALIILLNLPLALIGGVYAILFTSCEISIPAIIGFISLFGIATRNGILLMSHYDDLQKNGYSIGDAIMQGSLDRLNPILMTALCSGLALIPLAVQGSLPGNEIQSPMAKVIIGGLFTSMFLNMYIIPIVYMILSKRKAN